MFDSTTRKLENPTKIDKSEITVAFSAWWWCHTGYNIASVNRNEKSGHFSSVSGLMMLKIWAEVGWGSDLAWPTFLCRFHSTDRSSPAYSICTCVVAGAVSSSLSGSSVSASGFKKASVCFSSGSLSIPCARLLVFCFFIINDTCELATNGSTRKHLLPFQPSHTLRRTFAIQVTDRALRWDVPAHVSFQPESLQISAAERRPLSCCLEYQLRRKWVNQRVIKNFGCFSFPQVVRKGKRQLCERWKDVRF